ncbi:hypothetical protein [Streptomyces sp. NPDC090025]|uniref:hypothetical protein n=1 Tax=Streptomyces sp. NPDC090025 TaxID=3365922 RepID=UPI0038370082
MATNRPKTAENPIKVGSQAADALAQALRSAGFTLPSLTGDYPVMGCPMVQLGGLRADIAIELAEWIQERA